MNVALIGYGKMGHEIEAILKERQHQISFIIDVTNLGDLKKISPSNTEVAIEFTNPSSVIGNITSLLNQDVPVVAGTTGWHDRLEEMTSLCKAKNGSLFYASNYSLGVNVLFAVNEFLAKLMNKFPEYEVRIDETHHTQKLDAPSGTAISLAQQIITEMERKKNWKLESSTDADDLLIHALREGDVKGFHEVTYESETDYLKINHFAKTRKGFATGAVLAAEFIAGKKGVFTMRDMLGI